jgi:hypothetical protein
VEKLLGCVVAKGILRNLIGTMAIVSDVIKLLDFVDAKEPREAMSLSTMGPVLSV